MKKLACLLLLLTRVASTVPSEADYPPEGAVLIFQDANEVTLRWSLPRGQFTAELWSGGSLRMQQPLQEGSWTVPVERGRTYGWILRNSQGIFRQGRFGVANELSFSVNGRDGQPGAPGPNGRPGHPGINGGQIEAELQRDQAGMHLRIRSQGRNEHYLFAEPGVHFQISAKGGNGGKGADGDDFRGYKFAVGRAGGAAGWGGNLKITTYNAPWREYLDVDVSAGTPGAGGKGGKYRISADQERTAPDGPAGKPGQGGRVDTRLPQ